ncbi:MAG: Ig-like domain-containing protein [Verrucomicrobiae bacterium]|nr:Ig-like domain-containing protein [Verrucomicrobiae bacterium]
MAYRPAWTADAGVPYTLSSGTTLLQKVNGAYFQLSNGLAYNPARGGNMEVDVTLTANSGAAWLYNTASGLVEQRSADGKRLFWSDSGVVAENGDRIRFEKNGDGRIAFIDAGADGQLDYRYDDEGDLFSVTDMIDGKRSHYGYQHTDTTSLLAVVLHPDSVGEAVRYDSAGHYTGIESIGAYLGNSRNTFPSSTSGQLNAGAIDLLAFTLTDREIATSLTGQITIGVEIIGNDGFNPSVATIEGATAGTTVLTAGHSFGVFTIDSGGTFVITVAGTTPNASGSYTANLTLLGDFDEDGDVDLSDRNLLNQANAVDDPIGDLNRDGSVNNVDVFIVDASFGFVGNRAPVAMDSSSEAFEGVAINLPLSTFAQDPDGDLLRVAIASVTGGRASINGTNGVLSYLPNIGFNGIAQVDLLISDGVNRVERRIATINVDEFIIDGLRFSPFRVTMDVGSIVLVNAETNRNGQSIPVPSKFLTYESNDNGVASVSPSGYLGGLSDGVAIITGTAGNQTAVMTTFVGTSDDLELLLVGVNGIHAIPDVVALIPGETRSVQVTSLGVEIEQDQIVLVSGDTSVADITADGLVRAVAPGHVSISVISGAALSTVEVMVVEAMENGAMIGTTGGAVKDESGAFVSISPDSLPDARPVFISPIETAQFSQTLPPNIVGGFQIDFGSDELDYPAQVGIPVNGLAAGDEVIFMRADTYVDKDGVVRTTWVQDEIGLVGTDGIARSQSWPYAGFFQTGQFAVVKYDVTTYKRVRGAVSFLGPFDLETTESVEIIAQGDAGESYSVQIPPSQFSRALSRLEGGLELAGILDTEINIPITEVTTAFVVHRFTNLPPVITELTIDPDAAEFEIVVNNLPTVPLESNRDDPFVTSAEIVFVDDGGKARPVLELRGSRFFVPSPPGATELTLDDVRVRFDSPELENPLIIKDIDQLSMSSGQTSLYQVTPTLIRVPFPRAITLGLTSITVEAPSLKGRPKEVAEAIQREFTLRFLDSNSIRLPSTADYSFAALTRTSSVGVVRAGGGESNLVATVPIESIHDSRPRSVAVTSDNTRVYVALEGVGAVAVVDAIALQEIDTKPVSIFQEVNGIDLPVSSRPFGITIDPQDRYAYVTDGVSGNVYVIDISPGSDTYHELVRTIALSPAPYGLRDSAINADGTKLFIAAPGETIRGGYRGAGHVLVIDVNVADRENGNLWSQVAAITGVNTKEPYGVTATDDPQRIIFTDRANDGAGYNVIIDRGNGQWEVRSAKMILAETTRITRRVSTIGQDLASILSPPDVHNTQAAALIPGNDAFGFVTGYNSRFQDEPGGRAGGNVGVILDPLGLTPTGPVLIAATANIPGSFPDNLVVSPDGRLLLVGLQGSMTQGLDVFDINGILATIEAEMDGGFLPWMESLALGYYSPGDPALLPHLGNLRTKSLEEIAPQGVTVHVTGIGTGDMTRGLASTVDFLELISPVNGSSDSLLPTLHWRSLSPSVTTSKLYLSIYPGGEGLFPGDIVSSSGEDLHPYRILNGVTVTSSGDGEFTFTLPPRLTLTAGQTYYWGVEATGEGGKFAREWATFTTTPVTEEDQDSFSSVTLLTHGFDPRMYFGNPSLSKVPEAFVDMGELISAAGGNGVVMLYNRTTGKWVSLDGQEPIPGRPLVLVSDWVKESNTSDSGFSEAAADTLFAAIVGLDKELSGKVLNSPLHFIGHSRGTVVTSEIVQRFGWYFPEINNIHMTTLDVHDFVQDSLDVDLSVVVSAINELGQKFSTAASQLLPPLLKSISALGDSIRDTGAKIVKGVVAKFLSIFGLDTLHFADFRDSTVQVWDNVAFADNYYQELGDPKSKTFTPNGASLPQADINVKLDGRAGFTQDDFKGTYLDFLDKAGIGGAAGPHSRVWKWYAGTIALGLEEFADDRIWRRLKDAEFELGLADLSYHPVDYNNVQWYNAMESAVTLGMEDPIVSAGIGAGWAFSELGGIDVKLRPKSNLRAPIDYNNTNYDDYLWPKSLAAVPEIYNGDFQHGTLWHQRSGFEEREDGILSFFNKQTRVPLNWAIPGWYFHNGNSSKVGESAAQFIVQVSDGLDEPLNYALGFSSDQKSLIHNRFYLPKGVDKLEFDLRVDNPGWFSSSITLSLESAIGGPTSFSQTFNLSGRSLGEFFEVETNDIMSAGDDIVVLKIAFSESSVPFVGELLDSPPSLYIDNIEFAFPDLEFLDDNGNTSDGLIFVSAPESGSINLDPDHVNTIVDDFGIDQFLPQDRLDLSLAATGDDDGKLVKGKATLTIQNPSTKDLVLSSLTGVQQHIIRGSSSLPGKNLQNGPLQLIASPMTIPANGSGKNLNIELDLSVPIEMFTNWPGDHSGKLIQSTLFAGLKDPKSGQLEAVKAYEIYFLLDGSDDDVDDLTLKTPKTLIGATSSISIALPEFVNAELQTSTTAFTESGISQINGERIFTVVFEGESSALGEQRALTSNATVRLTDVGGKEIGIITVQGRSVDKQILSLNKAGLRQVIGDKYDEILQKISSGETLSKGEELFIGDFRLVFENGDAVFDEHAFVTTFDQLREVVEEAYAPFIEKGLRVVDDSIATNELFVKYEKANPNPTSTSGGLAHVDFAYHLWSDLVEEDFSYSFPSGYIPQHTKEGFIHFSDRSISSQTYIIGSMMNLFRGLPPFGNGTERLNTVYLEQKLNQAGTRFVGDPLQRGIFAEFFGEMLGFTAAHESGHNFGLLDTYRGTVDTDRLTSSERQLTELVQLMGNYNTATGVNRGYLGFNGSQTTLLELAFAQPFQNQTANSILDLVEFISSGISLQEKRRGAAGAATAEVDTASRSETTAAFDSNKATELLNADALTQGNIRSEFLPAEVSTGKGFDGLIGPILAGVDQTIPVIVSGGGAATERLTFFGNPESRFGSTRTADATINGKDLTDSTDRVFGVLGWDDSGFLVLRGSAPVIVQSSLDIELEVSIPNVEGGKYQNVDRARFISGGGAGALTFLLDVVDMPHPDLYFDDFELYLGANVAPIALSTMTRTSSDEVGAEFSFTFNPESLKEITDVYLRVTGSTEAYSDKETINVIEVPGWLNDTASGSVQYSASSASYTINGTVPGQLQYDVPEGDLPALDYLQFLFPDQNFDTKIEVGARVKVTAPISLLRAPVVEATNVTAEVKVLGIGLIERSVTPLNLNQGKTQISGRLDPLTLAPAGFAIVHGPVSLLDHKIELLKLDLGVDGPSLPLVVGGSPVPVGEAGFGVELDLEMSLEKADLTFGFGLNFTGGSVVVVQDDTFIRVESQLKANATGIATAKASAFGAVEGEVEIGAKIGLQLDILFEPHYGVPNANPNKGYGFSIDEKSNARISAAYGLWVIGRADLLFFGEVETPAVTYGPKYFELSTSTAPLIGPRIQALEEGDEEGTVLLYPDRPLDLEIPTPEQLVGELPPPVDDVAKVFAGESTDNQKAQEAADAFHREMDQIGNLIGRDESEIDALLRSRGYTIDQAPIDGDFGPTRVFTIPLLNENDEPTGYTLGIRVDPNPVGYAKRPEPLDRADERTNWHGHIEIIPTSALDANNNYHYTAPVAYFNGSAEYITKDQFDSIDDYAKEQHIILTGPPPPHVPTLPAHDSEDTAGEPTETQGAVDDDFASSIDDFVTVAESAWRAKAHELPELSISFGVANLPENQLAFAQVFSYDSTTNVVTGRLVVDDDGAGSGWFIDLSPRENGEFQSTLDPHSLSAKSEAAGRYDLLTVINHEVGHLLGFSSVFPGFSNRVRTGANGLIFVGDDYEAALDSAGHHLNRNIYGNDLMSTNIPIGMRRLPSDLAASILRDSHRPVTGSDSTEADIDAGGSVSADLAPLDLPKFVVLAEQLEESLTSAPPTGVRNGTFSEGQPGSEAFKWKQIGAVAYANGVATLSEGSLLFTDLSQTFVLPEGSKELRFTVSGLNLNSNAGGMLPPDAFEVALLDALDLTPVGGSLQGLDFTDALLNIQPDGTVRKSSRVTITGPTDGSGPFTVKINVAGLAVNRAVTLYFDLIRFGDSGSAVSVSNVNLSIGVTEAAPNAEPPVVNGGADQRSMVRAISVQFDQDVSGSIGADDLMLENLTTGEEIEIGVTFEFNPVTLTATWSFDGLTGRSLPDGNYRATLFGDGISNATGTLLDGDGDGNPGGDLHFDFHRYFGDSDGDRDVDFADTFAYQKTHFKIASDPTYDDTFDWDNDGDIDALDLFQFRKRYLTKLEPEPSPARLVTGDPVTIEEPATAEANQQGESEPSAGRGFTRVAMPARTDGSGESLTSTNREATTSPARASEITWRDPWQSPFDRGYGFGFNETGTGADDDEEATSENQEMEASQLLLADTAVLESS